MPLYLSHFWGHLEINQTKSSQGFCMYLAGPVWVMWHDGAAAHYNPWACLVCCMSWYNGVLAEERGWPKEGDQAHDDEWEPWPLLYITASGREFYFDYFESNNREMNQNTALRCNARSQNKTSTETSAQYKPVLLTTVIYLCFSSTRAKAGVSKPWLQEGQGVFKPAWWLGSVAVLCGRMFLVRGGFPSRQVGGGGSSNNNTSDHSEWTNKAIGVRYGIGSCLVTATISVIAQRSFVLSLPGLSPSSCWVSLPNYIRSIQLAVPKGPWYGGIKVKLFLYAFQRFPCTALCPQCHLRCVAASLTPLSDIVSPRFVYSFQPAQSRDWLNLHIFVLIMWD